MSRDKVTFRAKKLGEDAPTNSVTNGGPVMSDPVFTKKRQKELVMLRRKADFAGAAVFEVAPSVFHSARLEKRKGKHWRTYLEEDDCLSEIREFATKNPKTPIILQNERTGEMCYARYGRKRG